MGTAEHLAPKGQRSKPTGPKSETAQPRLKAIRHNAPSLPNRTVRMPGLDGARGLAVLLVLLDHASDGDMKLFAGADLNRAGKYGVYLFFVLSAFLLTHQFSARKCEEFFLARTWLDYAWRRFLRIFPLYAAVLVAYVLMGKLEWMDIATHLTLSEGKRQFWTIPVEVKFYALLPLIAFALFGAGRKHWLLGGAAGAVAVVATWGLFELEQFWSARPAVLLARNLAPFLMGLALALLYGALLRRPALQQRVAGWLDVAAVASLVVLATRLPAVNDALFSSPPFLAKRFDAEVGGAVWSVFLLGVLLGKGWLRRGMEWLPLRYLGWISFSAYLWHTRFLNDVDDLPVPSQVRLLVYLVIVVGVSTVSYWLIERPLARLRWDRRRKRETPAQVAAPRGGQEGAEPIPGR